MILENEVKEITEEELNGEEIVVTKKTTRKKKATPQVEEVKETNLEDSISQWKATYKKVFKNEIDGEVTRDFPVTAKLAKAKPVYKVLPGWKEEIRGITEYDKLPENCRKYIEFIEKELEVPITMVSNGPGRHEIIYR